MLKIKNKSSMELSLKKKVSQSIRGTEKSRKKNTTNNQGD